MQTRPKYYAVQFRPGRYKICRSRNNSVVYDNEPHGQDKPLIFDDQDKALKVLELLNLNLLEDE